MWNKKGSETLANKVRTHFVIDLRSSDILIDIKNT